MRRPENIFFLLMLFVSMAGCSPSDRRELPVPPADLLENSEKVEIGRQLFYAHCIECHGSLAEGRTQRAVRLDPAAPDFRELRYRRVLPGYLYRRIEHGRNVEPFNSAGSVMPPWGQHFNQDQIWSLVAFIRHRAGKDTFL